MNKTNQRDPVPSHLFGIDHFSTLLYLETRIVDHGGIIEKRHMRCDNERHPSLAHLYHSSTPYPTRLQNSTLEHHDDWDCILDLEQNGFLKIDYRTVPRQIFEVKPGERGPISGELYFKIKVNLTSIGWKLVSLLRKHRGNGNSMADFIFSEYELQEIP